MAPQDIVVEPKNRLRFEKLGSVENKGIEGDPTNKKESIYCVFMPFYV